MPPPGSLLVPQAPGEITSLGLRKADDQSRLLSLGLQHPVWVLFALALVARLGLLVLFSSSPHFGVQAGDMRFYHDWALRIFGGHWTDHHAFYGLPGYAYLLAGVYKLVGIHPAALLVLQAVVDAGTAALVFLLAKAVLPRTQSGLQPLACASLASLGWILFLPAQTFAAVLMPTVLATACYWFCIYQALSSPSARPWWKWLGLGGLVGLTAMAVATVLFATPLLLVAALRTTGSRLRRFSAALLLIAGIFVGSAPASLHNYLIAHEPVFLSAHGGINFWIGNAPGATGYPKIPAGLRAGQQELLVDSIALAERETGHALTRAEISQHWSAKAWTSIRQNPAAWGRLLARKVKNFWNAFSYDDVTIIALLREEGVLFPGIGFGVAAVLGLAGMALVVVQRYRKRGGVQPLDADTFREPATMPLIDPASPWWIVAAVLLHLCALLPVFITERYRLAAVPGLLVLGAYFLSSAIEAAHAQRWKGLAGLALLLLGVAAFVYQPAPRAMLVSMEPYNLAISELEVGQLDRAEQHLATVAALTPENASVFFAQGNLWLKRGDRAQARALYRQSLEREPRNADAWANLGVIAYQEEHWDQACRLFQAALSIQPDDVSTRQLLTQAMAKR